MSKVQPREACSYCFQTFIYLFFISNLFYLFIFGCVGSSLLCTGFLYLHRAGATLNCGVWASHCSGFSCCRARAVGVRASVVAARGLSRCGSQALERRLSSCGARLRYSAACGIFRTRARTCVPCLGRWILNHCATWEAPVARHLKLKFRQIDLHNFLHLMDINMF